MKTFFKLSVSVLAGAFACAANAQLINVDFKNGFLGVMGGAAYVGNPGDIWNGFNAPVGWQPGNTLLDSNGNASSVTMDYYSTDGGQLAGVSVIQPDPNLTYDYLQSSFGNSLGFTLHGLTPNADYNMAMYVASDSSAGGSRSVEIVANSTVFYATGDPDFSYVNGENVAYFTCKADAYGQVNVLEADGQTNTSGQIVLSGFQIQAAKPVPEPATIALVGLGFGAILRRKTK